MALASDKTSWLSVGLRSSTHSGDYLSWGENGDASVLQLYRMLATSGATAVGSIRTRHILRGVVANAKMITAATCASTLDLLRGLAGLVVMSVHLDIALKERARSLQQKSLEFPVCYAIDAVKNSGFGMGNVVQTDHIFVADLLDRHTRCQWHCPAMVYI